jgi:lipopolysaccharide heptosyltransferase II
VRLPNWLGDVVMALPLLRALRASRPDAELVLVAKKPLLALLESWGIADRTIALPPQGLGYFAFFRGLRAEHPDIWLLFTNSFRGDLEAWLTGCRQRFGLLRPGKRRPLLTHAYVVPADFDERTHHQLELWENFLRHFGLNAPLDRTPIPAAPTSDRSTLNPPLSTLPPIGLIPGSENTPAKRWPVAHWRALIAAHPTTHFVLFGTANDAPITAAIAAGHDPSRVENLAGRTTLPDYCARLRACRLLVTNDTGGLHLANALGVPLLGLFGPTNPLRTGPVFSGPTRLLQPPACPPTGGGNLADLSPETVSAALHELLTAPRS